MRCLVCTLVTGMMVFGIVGAGHAALIVTQLQGPAVENFNSFRGEGFAPSPESGQLDSNAWRVHLSNSETFDYGETAAARFAQGSSAGGITAGGIWAFEVAPGDFSLGVQPIGTVFTPGFIEARIHNLTGQTVSAWQLSYDIFVYNDQGRANSFNFSFSTDGELFTDLPQLDFISPEAADDVVQWERHPRSIGLNAVVAPADYLYLRWAGDDVSGTGSRDEFALNNLSVEAVAHSDHVIPEPAALTMWGLLAGMGAAAWGLRRRRGKKTREKEKT